MRAKHIFLYFLTLAFVLSGCAHTLEATLSPDLEIDRASIGQGKTIALKVVDDRADEVVALVGREDKITIREDIGEIIYWEIAEGLEAKGFLIAPFSNEAQRALEVEVRLIKIFHTSGFWTAKVHAKSAVKAKGQNNGDTYEKMYRYEETTNTVFGLGDEAIEEILNKSIVKVLKKMFQDEKLMSFLAK